jgi:hypothetical protein
VVEVDVQYLKEQAARCRRLAQAVTDPNVQQALLEMAEEFEARAATGSALVVLHSAG